MRKHQYITWIAMALLLLLSVSAFSACTVGTADETTEAQTTEAQTTEAQTTEDSSATDTETTTDDSEGTTEAETETPVEPMDFDALDLTPYITLGEYKNLPITLKESAYVSALKDALFEHGKFVKQETTAGDAIVEGDYINVNYKGFLDGEAFSGGTANNQDIVVSENSGYIEGFASGFIGAKAGETKSFEVTFPEDYHAEDLAGKQVTFEFTVNCVYRFPELTDDIATTLSNGAYPTAQAYEGYLRNLLIQPELWSAIIKNATIKGYPEQQVQYYYQQNRDYYEYYAGYYGLTYEELLKELGIDDAYVMELSKTYVEEDLVYYAIKQRENIVMPESYYNEKLQSYIDLYKSNYGCTDEQIAELMDDIKENMTYDYAQELILSFADVTWE